MCHHTVGDRIYIALHIHINIITCMDHICLICEITKSQIQNTLGIIDVFSSKPSKGLDERQAKEIALGDDVARNIETTIDCYVGPYMIVGLYGVSHRRLQSRFGTDSSGGNSFALLTRR